MVMQSHCLVNAVALPPRMPGSNGCKWVCFWSERRTRVRFPNGELNWRPKADKVERPFRTPIRAKNPLDRPPLRAVPAGFSIWFARVRSSPQRFDSVLSIVVWCGVPSHHHIQGLGQSPGPFSCPKSPRHAGFRPSVLRVAFSPNDRNRLLSRPEPSLFSVWPAGRRRYISIQINNLRVTVQRQPRPPVRHQTSSSLPAAPPSRWAADSAETTAGSYTGAAARPGCSG